MLIGTIVFFHVLRKKSTCIGATVSFWVIPRGKVFDWLVESFVLEFWAQSGPHFLGHGAL